MFSKKKGQPIGSVQRLMHAIICAVLRCMYITHACNSPRLMVGVMRSVSIETSIPFDDAQRAYQIVLMIRLYYFTQMRCNHRVSPAGMFLLRKPAYENQHPSSPA
jgi:hypothetical protein